MHDVATTWGGVDERGFPYVHVQFKEDKWYRVYFRTLPYNWGNVVAAIKQCTEFANEHN